jgi:hypothetical protein
LDNSENGHLINCDTNPELEKEVCRIENELDIDTIIEQQCIRLDLAEYEKTRGVNYADGYMDGWNRCMSSLVNYNASYEKKLKNLESKHPNLLSN